MVRNVYLTLIGLLFSYFQNFKYTFLLIFLISTDVDADNDKCSVTTGGRLLLCDYKGRDYENPNTKPILVSNIYSLILKNSDNLHLKSENHQSDFYQKLVSYKIIDNVIVDIASNTFEKLHSVKYLHIENNNNWRIIKDHTFSNLTKLELLTIVNNNVEEVQLNAFRDLYELQTLELTYNKILQLPGYIFRDLNSLTTLLLHHNNIRIIEEETFQDLNKLTTLDLSYNSLTTLTTSTINNLPNLKHLFLGHNKITHIVGVFHSKSVSAIHLQNNKLQEIVDDLFKDVVNLHGIDISYNEISVLTDIPFKSLKSLIFLNAVKNKISNFDKIKQIKALVTY